MVSGGGLVLTGAGGLVVIGTGASVGFSVVTGGCGRVAETDKK